VYEKQHVHRDQEKQNAFSQSTVSNTFSQSTKHKLNNSNTNQRVLDLTTFFVYTLPVQVMCTQRKLLSPELFDLYLSCLICVLWTARRCLIQWTVRRHFAFPGPDERVAFHTLSCNVSISSGLFNSNFVLRFFF